MNFALLGPTCAGKSTLATLLADSADLIHISPGVLLREHRDKRTALGILTRRYLERGELAPDEVVAAIIEEAVCHAPPAHGLVFDGFPGTEYQAQFLEALLRQYGRRLDALIYLPIPEAVTFQRAARRIPAREDDRPEILRHRVRAFARNTGPVLRKFAEAGRLGLVPAQPPVDKVYQELTTLLAEIKAGRMPALGKRGHKLISSLLAPRLAPQPGRGKTGLNLVMVGGPGSGKGTHAQFVCEALGLPHISTGEIFRQNISQQTSLGKIAQAYMHRGDLLPDDITESMVRERLAEPDAASGFMLDGFPRTLPQAQALDEILMDMQRWLEGVIFLKVSDEEIVYRMSGRSICAQCQTSYHQTYRPPKKAGVCDADGAPLTTREDDNPDTIRARLKAFHGQTEPLIEHYRQRGLLIEISGMGAVDEVRERMLGAVKNWQTQMSTAA